MFDEEIFIPAGEFIRGTSLIEEEKLLSFRSAVFPMEKPQRKIFLDSYYIDKYPVTNGQFEAFVKKTGYKAKGTHFGTWEKNFSPEKINHPVVSVSWEDMQTYCTWKGKRLPTEAEWEKAARGLDCRLYPWGNETDLRKCNAKIYQISSLAEEGIGIGATTPVDYYPEGISPFGCYDMMGNVWEMVWGWLDVGKEEYYENSPYRNPKGLEKGIMRIMRGGAFSTLLSNCRCAFRIGPDSSTQFDRVGFRCARSLPVKKSKINKQVLEWIHGPAETERIMRIESHLPYLDISMRMNFHLLSGFPDSVKKNAFKTANALNARGWEKHRERFFEKAIQYYEKALETCPEFPLVHNNQGLAYLGLRNMKAAKIAFENAIVIKPDFINPYFNLGVAYWEIQKDSSTAAKYLRKAIKLDPNHQLVKKYLEEVEPNEPGLKSLINYLERVIVANPNDPNFHSLVLNGADLACQTSVPWDETLRKVFFYLGKKAMDFGFFAEAFKIQDHLINECNELLEPFHPDIMKAENGAATCLNTLGDYDSAIQRFELLIPKMRSVFGNEDYFYLTAQANYALCLTKVGDYKKSRSILEPTLALIEKKFGLGDILSVMGTSYLFMALFHLGEYTKGKNFLLKALEPAKESLGKEHPATLTLEHNLSEVYRVLGDIPEACRISEKIYEIRSRVLGPNHLETLLIQAATAHYLQLLGKNEKARTLFESALARFEKLFPKDHPDFLTLLNNYSTLLIFFGETQKAERILEKVYESRKNVIGPFHYETLITCGTLGVAKAISGNLQEASNLLNIAWQKLSDQLGGNHEISQQLLFNYSACLGKMGRYKDAYEIFSKNLFKGNQSLILKLSNLTSESAYLALKGYGKVIDLLVNIYLNPTWTKELSQTNRLFVLLISLHGMWTKVEQSRLRFLREFPDPQVNEISSKEIELNQKSAILRQLFYALSSSEKGLKIKRRNEERTIKNSDTIDQFLGKLQAEFIAIENQLRDLTRELGARTKDHEFKFASNFISIPSLMESMCFQSIWIQIVEYESFDFSFSLDSTQNKEKHYLALTLNSVGKVNIIPLGDVLSIDAKIKSFRNFISSRGTKDRGIKFEIDKDIDLQMALHSLGKPLAELLLELIPENIEDLRRLYFCPQGNWCLLPLECLPSPWSEGRFFIDEKFEIEYVGIPEVKSRTKNQDSLKQQRALVLSNPDYLEFSLDRQIFEMFDQLPGAAREGKQAAESLEKSGFKVIRLEGKDANYYELRQEIENVNLLHIATHGVFHSSNIGNNIFFVKEQKHELRSVFLPSPLQSLSESYLALAGANSWHRIMVIDDNDAITPGVLTALDVLKFNLSKLKLVVLSACQTGLGEILEGEGLNGFRRAFMIAGVNNIVMSLWSVDDTGTADLMKKFYNKFYGNDKILPSEALHQAQESVIASFRRKGQWPDPYYWAPFICYC